MNKIIRDDQGLDTALMMDGYSMEERQEAKQIIRNQSSFGIYTANCFLKSFKRQWRLDISRTCNH